jgi:hypothetical protein
VVPAERLGDLLVGGVDVSGADVVDGVLVSGAVALERGVVRSAAEVVGSPPLATDVDDGVGDGVHLVGDVGSTAGPPSLG